MLTRQWGYLVEPKPLSDEIVAAMDKLFNAWLAENSLISKGGVIYEGDKNGNIKQNKQNEPIKADPIMLRQKINSNDADGFAHYVQHHNKAVHLTIRLQEYPE